MLPFRKGPLIANKKNLFVLVLLINQDLLHQLIPHTTFTWGNLILTFALPRNKFGSDLPCSASELQRSSEASPVINSKAEAHPVALIVLIEEREEGQRERIKEEEGRQRERMSEKEKRRQ